MHEAFASASGTNGGGPIEKFADMVRAMDEGIGCMLSTLGELRLEANTLVVIIYLRPASGESVSLVASTPLDNLPRELAPVVRKTDDGSPDLFCERPTDEARLLHHLKDGVLS